MIKIEVKEGENIERALKRYKRKRSHLKINKEIKARQHYTKKSDNLVGVNSGKYQALFLTNGQVYFGKLAKVDNDTIKISDIFYLQVQQAVQPKEGEDKQGETQLVKLGEELHGPEDEMFIDRDQVLFWENLKGSGKVTEAISQYKK